MLTIKNVEKLVGYYIEFPNNIKFTIESVCTLPDRYKIYIRGETKPHITWLPVGTNCVDIKRDPHQGAYELAYGATVEYLSIRFLSDIDNIPIIIAPMMNTLTPYTVYDPSGGIIQATGRIPIGQQMWATGLANTGWTTGNNWSMPIVSQTVQSIPTAIGTLKWPTPIRLTRNKK